MCLIRNAIFFFVFSLALVHAQGSTSFIDLVAAEGYTTPAPVLAQCLGAAPDDITALECFHNIEVVDEAAMAACQGESLATCSERVAYPVPFYPEELSETVEDVYEEIYDRYYANVWKYAFGELLKCNLLFCNGGCIAQAIQNITRHAYGSLNTVYWQEIFAASLHYMPSTLWYNLPFPGYGAIILPTFSLEPQLEQYAAYAQSIDAGANGGGRGNAYTYAAPLFDNQMVPFDQSERQPGLPGLPQFEGLKRNLEPATLLEYQQFGFMSVFEAYGDLRLVVVSPLPCVAALPLPAVRLASTQTITVAEGYPLPRTAETPWVPSAVGSAVSSAEITAFLTLDPTPPPVTSEKPLNTLLTCPPATLDDLATVDIRGNLPESVFGTLASGSSGVPVTALQYLLRGDLLKQFDATMLEQARAIGLNIQDIDITELFDVNTLDAVTYVQGLNNLDVTGIVGTDTFLSLIGSTCEGDEGDGVFALQTLLGGLGFDITPSGIFDALTKSAVQEFQNSQGLTANGVVNERTWAALFSQGF
jgi:peptidoglycan hydrolase-like protein with peptidoglycan-binding domain